MSRSAWWAPAGVLAAGAVLATAGVEAQRTLALRMPLARAVTDSIAGYPSTAMTLSTAEERAAGVTSYLARRYAVADTGEAAFTLYVGYYAQQSQGRTIHSPKNCLPGAGWEPLASAPEKVATAGGAVTVNRYLLQNGARRAVVLYWYQGRGRVAWNEYAVKWNLLRDAALRHRSDEALARIVVPVTTTEAAASTLGMQVAQAIVPALYRALPD